MRLALKAQAQCRATIETLATMKNPPLVIAKQANISAGHQQVNNGAPSRAEVSSNQPNELFEHSHEPHGWSQERRERQAAAIHRWSPWKQATGPKAPAGKVRSSRNAFKGGRRAALRADLAYVGSLMAKMDTEALC
jgi:hypothetical protein